MKDAPITTLFLFGILWLVLSVVHKNETELMIGMMHVVGIFVALAVKGE